ncbi:alpha/beta hydrolase [Nonomuraea sp. NPDC050783]|uniref:alpha/beta hydrolase n=1 Tax=Nonomuraea sp. NPDC050783 TaxID=3154634 RepID=UPI003466E0DF
MFGGIPFGGARGPGVRGLMGRAGAAVVVLATAAGAVPATAVGSLAPPAYAATARLGWKPCAGEGRPAGMECAAIEVPVDWSRPEGRKVELELARLRATEPARRVGSVLGVPGGPGANGIEDLAHAAGDLTELRRRFDLVGYSPRNAVWRERMPASCGQPGTALDEPRDRRQYAALAAAMSKAFERCRDDDRTGLFAHMDSLSVARDMDAVRRALGEERLSFMANSYGGVPAAAYLRLFPGRVRALYVDGVVNQTEGWPRMNLVAFSGAERALARFGTWCAATPSCALHGEDATAVWRGLTRDADRRPVPVTSERFGAGELSGWHLRSFGFPLDPGPGHERWAAFARAVEQARRGDWSGFAEGVLGNARVWSMPGLLAMTCGDERGYTSYGQLARFRRQVREIAPSFAGAAFDGLGCAGWSEAVPNPARPLPVRGVPPVLGAGTLEGDFPWTERFVRMVPGSVTLGYDGPGHVLYLSGKKCPIAHATTYLTELRLPAPGTICPAE